MSPSVGEIPGTGRGSGFTECAPSKTLTFGPVIESRSQRPPAHFSTSRVKRQRRNWSDFLWRSERLVVEVDGFQFHSNRMTRSSETESVTQSSTHSDFVSFG
jgi:hypothetical protein